MNRPQTQTVSALKTMGYAFNTIYTQGRNVVLENVVPLLTKKVLKVHVATVYSDGSVEMGDVE